jgi:aspartyl/asparaginyl beta-hydroxylase (cupin superfamily)
MTARKAIASIPEACIDHDDSEMQYFRRIGSGIDPEPFLDEIAAVDSAWDSATGRQQKIKVQREALAIPLRGLRKSAIGDRKRRDVHASRWTTGSERFPLACRFLNEIAEAQDALPGRAKIVCLPAGRRVYPHIDRGDYYAVRDRYHLVLRSAAGSWLKAGDEEVRMQQGELWWFDNKQLHEAFNDGDQDRIHMIFDLLPRSLAGSVLGQVA